MHYIRLLMKKEYIETLRFLYFTFSNLHMQIIY